MITEKKPNIFRDERGGALLLALIGAIVLSITGISMLRQSQTEYSISTNHYHDKIALFAADAGINTGISLMKSTIDWMEEDVDFTHTVQGGTVSSFLQTARSGYMGDTETESQKMKDIEELKMRTPFPAGYDLNMNQTAIGINMPVSSRIYMSQGDLDDDRPPKARKEIQAPVVILVPQGH